MITRRDFLGSAALSAFAPPVIASLTSEDDESDLPKQVRIFTFNKEKLTVGIVCDSEIRRHHAAIVASLKSVCDEELKKYNLRSAASTSMYLISQAIDFNKEIRKLERAHIKVTDRRDPNNFIDLTKSFLSPEDMNRFGLVCLNFPLKLDSDQIQQYETDYVDLITYFHQNDGIKDGILIRYFSPLTSDTNGPKGLTQTIVPSDIPTFIIKGKKVYFVDITKAIKPEKKEEKKKENEPRKFASGYLLNSNS